MTRRDLRELREALENFRAELDGVWMRQNELLRGIIARMDERMDETKLQYKAAREG